MRVTLTYCLLKIPAKIGNPSSFLPSNLDEAVEAVIAWTYPLAA